MNGHKIAEISDHMREILKLLDVWNPDDDNIVETPSRVSRYLCEFLLEWDDGNTDSTFESIEVDQLVIVKEIPFWSLCSHHLLPFKGFCSVGYMTGEKVIGLSKIPRIVQRHAHKLQLQERMAHQIADDVQKVLDDAKGIAVYIEAEHSCMQLRGIRSEGKMVTSVLRGDFRDELGLRQEFLSLVR